MTNGEKYKTAQERAEAFQEFCSKSCADCCLDKLDLTNRNDDCAFAWLDLEAEEEKPEPCPFCGSENISCEHCTEKDSETNEESAFVAVICYDCGYQGKKCDDESDAISAHNRVAKKCSSNNERLDSAEKVIELAGCLTNMSIIDAVHYKATHASMKYENGRFMTIEDPVASQYKLLEEQMIPVFRMLKEAVADYKRVAKK